MPQNLLVLLVLGLLLLLLLGLACLHSACGLKPI
jgi:hypothetical protein